MHAQLRSSAELSLWARIDGLEREALHETRWKRRALVKLWTMRGTLHLLPSAELGVWLSALGTYTNCGNTGHAETDVLAEAVGRALEGRLLTREALALGDEAVEVDVEGQRASQSSSTVNCPRSGRPIFLRRSGSNKRSEVLAA